MQAEHLKAFAEIGGGLWADPALSSQMTTETFTAAALLDLSDEGRIERAAKALLERADRAGNAAQTRANLIIPGLMREEFYKLEPVKRLVLMALHRGHWSYARLARILNVTPDEVESLAWGARLQLSEGNYPAGAATASLQCPTYDSKRPWTQRFLDDELGNRDRLFLQNHLMACESCRRALGRCRDLYYSIEKRLPLAQEDTVSRLAQISHQAQWFTSPENISLKDALARFSKRRDARLGMLVIAALIVKILFF